MAYETPSAFHGKNGPMPPRVGLCVARVGFVMMVLFTVASAATQITYAEGPPENNWADNVLEMGMLPLFWVAVATEEETNFALIGILLVHVGGFLGLTVMAVGLAMAGAGASIKEGAPRIGLCVAVVGFLIAVLCAVHMVLPDMGLQRLSDPFGNWSPDAAMTCQALWLLGGFVGFNLVVVGLATAGAVTLTGQPGTPASSPGKSTQSPLSQLRERTWPIRPRQGLYVALVGLVIIVPCVAARLHMPDDGYFGIFGIVSLYLGVFVGLVALVVGLVLAAVGAFLSHLTVAVSPGSQL